MRDYRKEFPFFKTNKHVIYFDSGATALKHEKVIEAEYEYMTKYTANHHAHDHENGIRANEMVKEFKENVKKFINADSTREIIITNGTTHGLNLIAFGLKRLIQQDDEIVVTEAEHVSNLIPWIKISKEQKAHIKIAPLNSDYQINLEQLKTIINAKTKIVAFNHVSNTMGILQDVEKIVKTIRSINPNVFIVLDAAQSSAHTKIDVQAFDVDFISFSAHKMFGSFGVGTIYGKYEKLNLLEPLLYGGGGIATISEDLSDFVLLDLPYRLEIGTLNTSGIAGFNAALKVMMDIGIENIHKREAELKTYLVKKIKTHDLEKEFIFYNLDSPAPVILFNSKKIHSQDLASFADKKYHIAIRAGKHCAINLHNVWKLEATCRATFTIYNTENEIDLLIKALLDQDDYINWIV